MKTRLFLSAMLSLTVAACDGGGSGGAGGGGQGGQGGAAGGQGGATGGQGGGGTGGAALPCLAAEGAPVAGSGTWEDGAYQATVTVTDPGSCARTYSLATTAPLRDGLPENPRAIVELEGQPVVRTGNDVFDALYALALAEVREASVDSIHDGAFNGGAPLPCPPGGCFETGRLWTYVWTRDTAYSVALGLGLLDPTRAKNSLLWKLSPRRDGTGLEIVQDTGTGGSWPVSSDRVVWAMGARALLDVLGGDERAAFAEAARQAVVQTAERDRLVVWDESDGLYRGEQSFLDWREQTYAAFTATDTVQIAMSKALGTNVAHLSLLELARDLSAEAGDAAASAKYAGWADDLRAAIGARFWLAEEGLPSSFLSGPLDDGPTRRFDLLGTALAVLSGSLDDAQAAEAVASYPHLERGAPVIWPQQQDVAIYHNRSLWPFVTAFWAKAAARARNGAAVAHAARSLIRGAALNLSNMENFEAVTGATWVDEGPTSGPVVDSHRQLWSVAGYVSLVHEVLFGLETSKDGLRFAPSLPAELAASLFGSSESIALSRVPYRGKRVSVRLRLPPAGAGGLLAVSSVMLDGVEIGGAFTPADALADGSVFEVTLGPSAEPAGDLALAGDPAIYTNVFGPRTPSIDTISIVNDRVRIGWSIAEAPADVTFAVYRDGVRIADALPGATSTFDDVTSAAHATTTYCYAVEARFASGNASQRSRPSCYWGPGSSRVDVWDAQSFSATGGSLTFQYGKWHYEDWGDPTDTLTLAGVVPAQSGLHWLQVSAGNGAGGFTTGITCGVKAIEVWDGATLVARGELVTPHLGTWDDWRDSNLVPAVLQAGKPYAIVIREDEASGNMSDLDHFSLYGGTGGLGGRFDKVNVAEIKLLAMGP